MRYLPLLLVLTACQSATSPVTDAGTDRGDAVMLRFDTGADTDTRTATPDAGGDAMIATDAGLDTGADAVSPTDTMQTDLWSWQTDAFHPSTDAGICTGQMPCNCESEACGYSAECQTCHTKWILGQPLPAYCATEPLWGAFLACFHI